ncbi:TfoX/Sxy family protein [Arthrobacter sp. SA17]
MSNSRAHGQALSIADRLTDLGIVGIGPFFGGAGLSLGGRQFGFVMNDELYFRVDEESLPDFEVLGSEPFRYNTHQRTVTVASYWQVPDEIRGSEDLLGKWASSALQASRR